MKRLHVAVLVTALALSAGNRKLDRLQADERTHYEALKVWMDAKERKAFLKLKTREERDAWLKGQGLWERFYQYDRDQREQIAKGDVHVGWTQDMVYMAWGPPHQRRKLGLATASRSELFVYRFEVDDEGHVLLWEPGSKETHNATKLFRYELTVLDTRVAEMARKDGWGL